MVILRGLSLLSPVLASLGWHRMLTLMKGQAGRAENFLALIAPFGMGRATYRSRNKVFLQAATRRA
jgi:hypothetical protein